MTALSICVQLEGRNLGILSQKKSERGRDGRENEVARGEVGRQTGRGKRKHGLESVDLEHIPESVL